MLVFSQLLLGSDLENGASQKAKIVVVAWVVRKLLRPRQQNRV